MKFFLLIVVCFLTSLIPLKGQILADSLSYKLNLMGNPEVSALRANDTSKFEAVQNATHWEQYDSTYVPMPGSSIWLKFQIENQSKTNLSLHLHSGEHYTRIFQQKESGFQKLENGLFVPLTRRANKTFAYFIPIGIPSLETSQFYVRLDVNHLRYASVQPVLYSEKAYSDQTWLDFGYQKNSIAFIYLYLISLLTIMIFTMVFWLKILQKLYLYYLGYLFFQLLYGLIVLGRTLAPIGKFFQHVPRLAFNLFEPSQFAFIGFYILFIIKLLSIKEYDRLLSTILKYMGLACFLYAILLFVFSYTSYSAETMSVLFNVVRLIILPLNFVLLFWILYKVKHPLMIYFIVGQSFFFVGALISSFLGSFTTTLSMEGFNFFESPNIIFQIGLLAEVYCFSLALGQNVFMLQKEKEKANNEVIAHLEENKMLQERMNRELDEKVNSKTEELIHLYMELENEKEQKIKDDFSQRIKETEMVALRSQMNPHFIFNSLNAIKHLIMTARNEDAILYLDDFSSLLRGILQNSKRKKITVEEELEILELYLSLERNRMGPDFKFNINVMSRESLSQFHIPPLLLQPIVENAIWHGLHPRQDVKKCLEINFDTSEDLIITIEDNGIGRHESFKKERLHKSMGSNLVMDRLTLYNHLNDHSIHLKTFDLLDGERALGTRITLTYQF